MPHLYQAWKSIWNINVSVTDGYPNYRKDDLRRGFNYEGVQVLPRQVCGVYTTTINRDTYPGGIDLLEGSSLGGRLFETILFQPVRQIKRIFSRS